ncbi:RecF/RecN/SMC [Scheffersomyces xylosifermentans]|uniref:RecF/RecN/SMC n=1 Tax=Scheffersomyces xylosifermentans TaxID=1304137 RepID=UPI00315CB85D
MYIKKIIIQGFKTYKNATVIDLLSPQHNVVVGRNGSGKSNFFSAIRFVLSDDYTHMTREERQGLIHEGSGTVMSAYVEIIFDNSDGRIPLNRTEVLIRRTIGLKKDDYSLDGKSATRSDILNLLESAGFSRSNPYYIVPQGRITSLTNSKDADRLELLKEVSGATVFENKLKESEKEMKNSTYKKQRIDETLASIDERLSDLQIESADLKKYQGLDKSKKVLEYNLFDREFNDLTSSIDEIEEKYNALLLESQQDLQNLDNREKLCQELTDTINELKISIKVSQLTKEQSDLDFNQLLNIVADKEVKLNDIKSSLESSRETTEELDRQIDQYRTFIAHRESEISKLKPELVELQSEESRDKEELVQLTSKQRALYSKQNRFSKFKTRKERDSWLNKEISSLKKELQRKENDINQLNSELKSQESDINEWNEKIDKLNGEILDGSHMSAVNQLKASVTDLKIKINELNDKRKILWRDEIRFRSIHDSVANDLNNANNLVNQTMDRSQAQGLAAVRSIAAKLNLTDNVFGPLASLFNVSDKYKTAAEVVAGNSLFHVVVDNDDTASLIMKELARTKSGRVTFMPLNRIEVSPVEYPDSNDHQCIALIKKLKYNDANVGKAITQVFGRTVVVGDLQTGAELVRSYKLSAITLDGDRADNRGVLTGGFRDYKKSRIDALKIQAKKRGELEKTDSDLKACVDEIEEINQKITSMNNELQLSVRDLDKLQLAQEPTKIQLSQLTNKKFNAEQELDILKINLSNVRIARDTALLKIKQHESELNSDFAQSLSDEELEVLESLTRQINSVETHLDKIVTKLSEFETQISVFESELANDYKPTLEKLLSQRRSLEDRNVNSFEETELERELESLHIELNTIQARNQSANDEFNKISNEISTSEAALKRANDQQLSLIKKLEKFSKSSEKILNRKAILTNRREEVQKKIRELGVLPEEAFQASNYDKFTSDDLLKKLNKVNEELSKYSHINKRAMEQYNTFTKQRDELVKRREELDTSSDSIESLIKNLETQKDEAIRKSFSQVAKSFNEIFETLVPAGVGNLIMQTRDDANANVDNYSDDENEVSNRSSESSIENYIGVSISVSFNSKFDEQQRIEQLSGGQKSLCAIALILAIQKCDPAPFYLFDEIDANLDTQYRTAVASMIHSLSSKAQFICTTFRPEMLQVADKFYGVMFSNKVSTVSEINREEAMNFVEGQQPR